MFAALLLLAGCSQNASAPLQLLFPSAPPDLAQQAAKLPYASIDMTLGRQEGLLVLAYIARNDTWFLLPGHVGFRLRDGYLTQTSGTPQVLLMTQFRRDGQPLATPPWRQAQAGSPFHYQVLREWRDTDGSLHADQANASLLCAADIATIKLPLTSLPLQACAETLTWSDGQQTRSTLWRNPVDKHLWRVQTRPWPGAPQFQWQVAKSWW